MKRLKNFIWSIILIFASFIGAQYLLAEDFYFEDINLCPNGPTFIHGINDNGEMVGSCGEFGFFYDGDEIEIIQYPGSISTDVSDINNRGEIVGDFWDGTNYHGFIYDGDQYTEIDYPDDWESFSGDPSINGINDKGQVVGTYWQDYLLNGFMWDGESFITISFPGYENLTFLADINNKGLIIGSYRPYMAGGEFRGFLYDGKTYTEIEASEIENCGDCRFIPNGINNKGQYVGDLWINDNNGTAFFFDGKEHKIINHPDAAPFPAGILGLSTSLRAINIKGIMFGMYTTSGYIENGFIAMPAPLHHINAILDFFNNNVDDDIIYGRGRRPWLANVRLWIFGQMLESAKWLLEHDRTKQTSKLLARIEKRCDGNPTPPDFIVGEAVPELVDMIYTLKESIDCE